MKTICLLLFTGILAATASAQATSQAAGKSAAQPAANAPAQPAPQPCTVPGANNDFLGIQTIRLWPGDAPQAKGKDCEDVPTLTVFEPAQGSANGTAAVILPGGAYVHLSGNLEGMEVAAWFAARGVRTFVLSYRLASNGYPLPVPLLDARRAVQTVRARAADYHINPHRILLMGFSAGGHLAALAATQPVAGRADSEAPEERFSSRPDYLVLGYPWIGAISSDTSHLSYCKLLNLMDQCEVLRTAYSPDLFVSKETPPTFWVHAADDKTVPVEQGLRFFEALIKAGVPAEAHIYGHGGHGFGLGKGDPELEEWPAQLEKWMRAQGLMTAEAAAKP